MEKNTKKHINDILEKYKLKVPKRTHILDKKEDFQVKPKTKSNREK